MEKKSQNSSANNLILKDKIEKKIIVKNNQSQPGLTLLEGVWKCGDGCFQSVICSKKHQNNIFKNSILISAHQNDPKIILKNSNFDEKQVETYFQTPLTCDPRYEVGITPQKENQNKLQNLRSNNLISNDKTDKNLNTLSFLLRQKMQV